MRLREDYANFLGKILSDLEMKQADLATAPSVSARLCGEIINLDKQLKAVQGAQSPQSNADLHNSAYYALFLNDKLCLAVEKRADLSTPSHVAARLCGEIMVISSEIDAVNFKGAHGSGWV
jgi:hypothetical protein